MADGRIIDCVVFRISIELAVAVSRIFVALVFSWLCLPLLACAGEPTVSFELYLGEGVSPATAQKWMRSLRDVGLADVRIRQGRNGDQGLIENRGTEASPRYHVTGILSTGDKLALPGGKFRSSDVGGIRRYINKLKDNGEAGLTSTSETFGLGAEQLLELHKELSAPVTITTQGKRAGDVMRSLTGSLKVKVVVDESARPGFAGNETVGDELQGVSVGTAMAAIVRPLGLVLVPFKPRGGNVQLGIFDVRKAEHSWPVGFPSDVPPLKAAPKLFEFLNAEIDDFALTDALSSIGDRVDAPFLFDYNSLARHGIEAGQLRVSFPKKRTYYKKVIDQILAQSGLKSEIRIDEANHPFLWVTTIRK